jgi:putative two-component system response regulator
VSAIFETAQQPDNSMTSRVGAAPAASCQHPVLIGNRPARILLVDDEPLNIKVARKYLSAAGYTDFCSATSSVEVLPLMIRGEPDIVLLDIVMPAYSGLDVLAAIRADDQLAHVPVVMLTAIEDRETKCHALSLGATDFLAKPVDPSELVSRVRNVLMVKAHHDQLRRHAADLERMVAERTAQLEASHQNVVHCLARAAEFRDDDTGRHVIRVGCYASIIAERLGLDRASVQMIGQAAQLHDVGKIGIPDAILRKPGKLSAEEMEVMRTHCGHGKEIFDSLTGSESSVLRTHAELGQRILGDCASPVLKMAATIALTHHEWWDGTGYPIGLAGQDIPLVGRITAVADVFDALSTRRTYKPAFALDRCFAILNEGRGTQFDPAVLDAFFDVRRAIVSVQMAHAELC